MNEQFLYIMNLLESYHFSSKDVNNFFDIIRPIFYHEEFLKRMNFEEFPHHNKTSLGEHIIKNSVLTYVICEKYKKLGANVKTDLAVKISMMHDLYEISYKNHKRKKLISNMHGFVHPIEAVINSSLWFPFLFDSKDSYKLVDGIIHHMWPFPVRKVYKFNTTEINNYVKTGLISEEIRDMIVLSTSRSSFGNISFGNSNTIEGKIVSFCDKVVSFKELISKK